MLWSTVRLHWIVHYSSIDVSAFSHRSSTNAIMLVLLYRACTLIWILSTSDTSYYERVMWYVSFIDKTHIKVIRCGAGRWKRIIPKKTIHRPDKSGRFEISDRSSTSIMSCCIWSASRWLCRYFSLYVIFRIIWGPFLDFKKLWGWSDPSQCWESTSANELSPKATVTPAFTTPYDDLRWVNFGDRGPSGWIVCNRATSHDVAAIRVIDRCLGSVCDVQKFGWYSKHHRVILLGRTRPHDVVQRHLTIARRSTRLCDDRATSCNGRAMVVR